MPAGSMVVFQLKSTGFQMHDNAANCSACLIALLLSMIASNAPHAMRLHVLLELRAAQQQGKVHNSSSDRKIYVVRTHLPRIAS